MSNHPVFEHTAHWLLWGWLVLHPNKDKSQWPGWKCNGGEYDSVDGNCFACMYDFETVWDTACRGCPLADVDYGSSCLNGVYNRWRHSRNDEERSMYAKQIRDWPIRPGVLYK